MSYYGTLCNDIFICIVCADGNIRIQQEFFVPSFVIPVESFGRAEYCQDGEWKIFCSVGIDTADVTVLCRQLGYESIGKIFI